MPQKGRRLKGGSKSNKNIVGWRKQLVQHLLTEGKFYRDLNKLSVCWPIRVVWPASQHLLTKRHPDMPLAQLEGDWDYSAENQADRRPEGEMGYLRSLEE